MNATLQTPFHLDGIVSLCLYLPFLVLAHFVGDWLIQSEYEATNKAKGKFWNKALVSHCTKYAICFIPVLWIFGESQLWLLLIFGSHIVIDRRSPVLWWRAHVSHCSATGIENTFAVTIVIDQVFHFIIIMVLLTGKMITTI